MTVSVDKKPVILVVHGVQLNDDDQLDQDEAVRQLVQSRLGGHTLDFDVALYRYENLNDSAQAKLKQLAKLIISSPISSILASSALDIVGDVVISLSANSTASQIRAKLKETILEYYQAGHPLYLLAHSLGTVYCFDVLNKLIDEQAYFERNNPLTWPVQGLLTIGSPLGLALFKHTGRNQLRILGAGEYQLKWLNYFDVNDPVVSGSVFGLALASTQVAEAFKLDSPDFGWFIKDFPVDTGQSWLLSHVAYWRNPMIGDGLINMLV